LFLFFYLLFIFSNNLINREPVISRVVPMAPASGRQIGVAIPMTASNTSATTSAPLWTTGSTTETTTARMLYLK
jgi:hypothetical protein